MNRQRSEDSAALLVFPAEEPGFTMTAKGHATGRARASGGEPQRLV